MSTNLSLCIGKLGCIHLCWNIRVAKQTMKKAIEMLKPNKGNKSSTAFINQFFLHHWIRIDSLGFMLYTKHSWVMCEHLCLLSNISGFILQSKTCFSEKSSTPIFEFSLNYLTQQIGKDADQLFVVLVEG